MDDLRSGQAGGMQSEMMLKVDPKGAQSKLAADLFLLHAPSVFDFRGRDDILFAYLSDSDSVNVTSIYEMYPLGFRVMKQYLEERGLSVEIVNLASLMLMHPGLKVAALLSRLEAPVFGLDLHWMAQCHGAIEVARLLRAVHPEAYIIMGGLSATYYASELIQYEAVDVVVQGYDTLRPVELLLKALQGGTQNLNTIPNLLFKKPSGEIVATGFTYKPLRSYNNASIDWSFYKNAKDSSTASKLIMTLPNSGCAYDCRWCGGSRYAYRNMANLSKTLILRDNKYILKELRSLGSAASSTNIYALQCYSETRSRLYAYLEAVKEAGYRSVSFEMFHLPNQETLRRMAESTDAYIMLSPESHDRVISSLAGRGNYTMQEMENWIPQALDSGISGVLVWFFIGMPRQTPESVLNTVDYCGSLLRKFRGKTVIPLICPMVPFLDPGSRFFEEPEAHGYRLFSRSLEEHRQAMLEPLWHKRLNYETIWMSREDLESVTYEAVARLAELKGEFGLLPSATCERVLSSISETTCLLDEIKYQLATDGQLSRDLRQVITAYNKKYLSYASDQILPAERPFGGRWFDDFTVPPEIISEAVE